ncbi:hypothetical protein COBT_003457, partial [Conglomerata obtusa]
KKKIILDDFRRGWLHSGKDIAVFDEKTLLNRTCYAKRGCEREFSDKFASICDIMYRTLINHNTKDNVKKFTSIINLCTKEVPTDKIMEKDNDKSNTKLEQATNHKRFRRCVSPTDNIQTIYNNDGNISYREIKSTYEARNNPESYEDYFQLLIYVVQIVEKSPRYQLYIKVSAINHWDGTTSYIKEVIPNQLVISVTKYETIILQLFNKIKGRVEYYKLHKDEISFERGYSSLPHVKRNTETEIIEIIFDEAIHFNDLNDVLKD